MIVPTVQIADRGTSLMVVNQSIFELIDTDNLLGDEMWDVPEKPELQGDLKFHITPEMDQWVRIIELVILSGKPNKDLCKIKIIHKLNFELMENLLSEYDDKEIIMLLKYGFPIERDMNIPLEMGGINHKSATEFPQHVDAYIEKEIRLGVTIGPFEKIPFNTAPVAISPISTRPKKESEQRRIILDCSWPLGASLNDGICKDMYLGKACNLRYPTVDMLAQRIYELRKSDPSFRIMLYKEDLDRAFRQLGCDPMSVPLLGYCWKGGYLFDLVAVMGCCIAPYFCQKTSNMIAYIHQQMQYFLLNYVDDFVGCEYEDKAWEAHQTLIRTFSSLGFDRSEKKSVQPVPCLEFVGNLVDAEQFTIGVTPDRKIEVLRELEAYRGRVSCTHRQLESLVGKLQFMSNCITPGRLFVSRLLNELKGMARNRQYAINDEMRKDIKWRYLFLPGFKESCILWLLDTSPIDSEMAVDACLKGAGGIRSDTYFRVKFPGWLLKSEKYTITHLELWVVIIGVKVWGKELSRRIIKIRSDNEAVSYILNTGRSQDLLLQKLLRELTWWLAKFEFKIKSQHLSRAKNTLPDLLNRWHEGPAVQNEFYRITNKSMKQCVIDTKMF